MSALEVEGGREGGKGGVGGWEKTRAEGEKEGGMERWSLAEKEKGGGPRRETRRRQKEKENCRIKKG